MFKKPFRIKSQIQLKSSEKKKFASDLASIFPILSSDEIHSFSSNKENIMKMKIITFKEELVEVYLIDKCPMFFDIVDLNLKLPTVYMCWKFPHIVQTITTNTAVLEKIKNGADLFMPGVYIDTIPFQNCVFLERDPGAINLISNGAAFAVGQYTISKEQAFLVGGRVLNVLHCFGDNLCKSHHLPMPAIDPPLRINDCTDDLNENAADIINEDVEKLKISSLEENVQCPEEQSTPLENNEERPIVDEKTHMNELLTYCFLKAVKIAPKTIYPILPATLYANHMLPVVPTGETLNIKKTTWKKLSPFLVEMAAKGVVQLETVRPNEYRLVCVNSNNPLLRQFVDPHHTPITVEASPSPTTSIQEVFIVTAQTQPIFLHLGLQKGDEITRQDVRSAITDYIRRENLALPEAPDRVALNNVLQAACKKSSDIRCTRLEVLTAILAGMPIRHKVTAGDDVIVHKANLPHVEFEIFNRSGNKKVTLISNLEGYGVDVAAFAKSLQHAAAASTTVTPYVPGKKGAQLQVQGNQIIIASRLLTESHGISEKLMRGLEKAPKRKK